MRKIWVCVLQRKQCASLISFLSVSVLFCSSKWKSHADPLFKASPPVVPSTWHFLCLPVLAHPLCFSLSSTQENFPDHSFHSVVVLKPVLPIHHAHLFCVYLPWWIILFKGRDYICWALDPRVMHSPWHYWTNGLMLRIDIWTAYDRILHIITILNTLYGLMWKAKSCPRINLDQSLMDSLVFIH